jgi:hypothetical protein
VELKADEPAIASSASVKLFATNTSINQTTMLVLSYTNTAPLPPNSKLVINIPKDFTPLKIGDASNLKYGIEKV